MLLTESIKKAVLAKFLSKAKEQGVKKIVVDLTKDEPVFISVTSENLNKQIDELIKPKP
jgi:hypothetical protein